MCVYRQEIIPEKCEECVVHGRTIGCRMMHKIYRGCEECEKEQQENAGMECVQERLE